MPFFVEIYVHIGLDYKNYVFKLFLLFSNNYKIDYLNDNLVELFIYPKWLESIYLSIEDKLLRSLYEGDSL